MDEKIGLVTDCHSILARRWNHFSQMLNVHAVSNVNQTEICPAEPLVPELSAFMVEVAIEKLQRSPSIDQVPAKLIKAGHRTICSEISKLLNSIWNKEELPEEWKGRSLYLFIRTIKQIVVIIESYHFCQLHKNFYPISCFQS
jgi:hypothetical protein